MNWRKYIWPPERSREAGPTPMHRLRELSGSGMARQDPVHPLSHLTESAYDRYMSALALVPAGSEQRSIHV